VKKGNEFNERETKIKNLFWICIFALRTHVQHAGRRNVCIALVQ
jgi:hypothetical protein